MVLSAGLGTRLRPFTEVSPKPLLPLLGQPIIQYLLDWLNTYSIKKTVFNLHHLSRAFCDAESKLDFGGIQPEFTDESQNLLGSAGGIRHALDCFHGDSIFFLNGDTLVDLDLEKLERKHHELKKKYGVQLTLAVHSPGHQYESYPELIADQKEGILFRITEPRLGAPFFLGTYLAEKEVFRHLRDGEPADLKESVLKPLMRKKKIGLHWVTPFWLDIGSPQLWYQAHWRMLNAFEAKDLFIPWRTRLMNHIERIKPGVWIKKGSKGEWPFVDEQAPVFWDPYGYSAIEIGQQRESVFGPNAVLYGAPPAGQLLQDGIGFEGCWESIREAV